MKKPNIIISPKFNLALKDLESVFKGLILMAAGTLATALIDAFLKWLSGLDLQSITVAGFPILIYLIPVITALFNVFRKYLTNTKYVN